MHHFVLLLLSVPTVFCLIDKFNNNPLEANVRLKRQAGPSSGSGSQNVGQRCNFNVDCINGAFCQNGVCACVTSTVNINNYCYPKINPEQPGCTYQEQCNSVWPGATCTNNICKCPYNRPPQNTRDGPVCYVPGGCPTNDQWPKLRDSSTNVILQCDILPAVQGSADQIGCALTNPNGEYLFDCIGSVQPGQGYCCPTRAFACIQPLDQGTTSNSGLTSIRYFFNSITQSCQEFSYLGAAGNGNNFVSIAQCESYCKQNCKRGTSEYNGINPTRNTNAQVKYCSVGTNIASACSGPNYQCERSGSTELCCPTVAFVCGPFGGIPSSTTPSTPFDVGYAINGRAPIVRWYYDSSRKTCDTFQYLGQIGNFNNFLSRQECEQFCAQAFCTRGEPLKDSSGFNAQICNGNGDCPATHICESTACCPSKYTVCNQPKVSGGVCNNYANRFWFNVQTGACEQFLFTGCQGNANNFESFFACQQFCNQVQGEPRCPQGKALKDSSGNFYKCGSTTGTSNVQCPTNYDCHFDGKTYGCCATRTQTCQISFDPGRSCGPTSSSRWFFDNTDKICKTFVYFGCDGNANNFATQRDCIDYCRADGCPDGGEPLKNSFNQPVFCGSTVASGRTSCPTTHACTTVSAASVSSSFIPQTVNPFIQNQFLNYCCPKKSTICSQNQDPGANCGVTLQRYYYDRNSRLCTPFTYFGCSGNSNNFPDTVSCQRYCDSSACQAGEQVYTNAATGQVQTCSSRSTPCPAGFNCVQDILANRFVCCGSPNTGSCPAGQKTYIDGFTGQARKCTVNVVGSCPNNYFCYYNPTQAQYFCCSGVTATTGTISTTNVCGAQQGLIVGGQPRQCSASLPCPAQYSCNPGPALAGQIQLFYCCTTGAVNPVTSSTSGCPSGYATSGSACSPYVPTSCVNGICQYTNNLQRFQCCTKQASTVITATTCSGNRIPYREPTLQQVVACTPGAVQNCPSNYQCERDQTNTQNICCPATGGSTTSTVCPTSQQPYSVNGIMQTCFSSSVFGSCPGGFQCQPNPSNPSLGFCCPSSSAVTTISVCRSGLPFLISGSQPQTCNPFAAVPCPSNYFCVLSTNTVYYCCSSAFRKQLKHKPEPDTDIFVVD